MAYLLEVYCFLRYEASNDLCDGILNNWLVNVTGKVGKWIEGNVTNHPHDLRLSLLTYANNPSPMQITLRWPSPQVSNAEHNIPKEYKSAYCSLTCQDSFPRPGHHLFTIISISDSDSLTLVSISIVLQPQTPDPGPCILYSFTLYHHHPSKLQITSFMNHINMSCMYHCFLSLILKLFLSYSLAALISLSAHITY